ncbi:MAG TPA: alpha/beta hydrolase [Syntrophales bacterium]|nr:alpha/beta hydrolase [Syntrophobacterales bacterium]HRR40820.1 alpha/beta hydrolase [Syntrophales bacterium]HRT26745.1 alpha/beta hydrolase [Syntrophales bacterium]HRT71348.1 alpha/beta hydrolase [Syntrophales bacterium]
MVMPRDRFVTVNNVETRYWAVGDGKRPLVLIHGLGASAEIWMHNIGAFSENHRVIVPDLPGFGRTDMPGEPFAPFDYLSFLDGFLRELKVERAVLCGQSLGGGIALLYAIRFPEKVEKLVLVDCAGLGVEVIWTLRWMTLPLIGELSSVPTRPGVALFFKLAVKNPAVVTDELIDLYHGYFNRPGRPAFLLRLVRSLVDFRRVKRDVVSPILENLHRVACPTLIVWGERDRVFPLSHGRHGLERIKGAEIRVMRDCGHIPFFERPGEFNELVLDFLLPPLSCEGDQARPFDL